MTSDEDSGGARTIAVCSTGSAVHWKSDFDVDCDGRRTEERNEDTDPSFLPETAWQQADGQHFDSARLPYIVVPSVNDTWHFGGAGIDGGTVAAVVHEDRVAYAVVGDIGPENMIGEGSYRLAEQLGIDPDPATGGVSAEVVDLILFPGVTVDPIEDQGAAVARGEEAATAFAGG
ncbi:glycoside hydrolase family 75 protein [Amycolatopsis antarctica]|uniref:glycoside hydrolase family 75 protein n=1 Tax=Amycolatopsis antarctica TaxID=1854586 RepID=UPI00196B9EBB|nr:glycoside hydrolase family 75 protein [Amycolatopsis antarctica]